jgi:hypothetical protein
LGLFILTKQQSTARLVQPICKQLWPRLLAEIKLGKGCNQSLFGAFNTHAGRKGIIGL